MILSVQKILLISVICLNTAFANLGLPNLNNAGSVDPENNNIMNPKVDYQNFSGRVSDKDETGRVLKVKVENNNVKFFKAGDEVSFKINTRSSQLSCRANVRSVEDFHFVIYVKNFSNCYSLDKYFPRGMILNFNSPILAQRVFEASKYREILLLKKDGFLSQLSQINNFLWGYEQEKVRVAAKYDEKINELRRQKRLAVDNVLKIKQEKILLQAKLQSNLNTLDGSLEFYRVERQEYMSDRWNMDHDTTAPVSQRPQKLKR
jgi:hypothetical protein